MSKEQESQNKPVETLSALGVSAKIFENVSDKGVKYDRVQIVRTYRDGDGFASTSTFAVDELPIVAMFAQQAYEQCITRRNTDRKARHDK